MAQDEKHDNQEPVLYEQNLEPDRLINDQVPWFAPLANQANLSLIPFIRGFMSRADEYPAAGTIFGQAVSDFMSLLNELAYGTGRSAVRSARSLIEHSVNIHDVESSTTRATQYMEHLGFGAEFSRDFKLGLDLLPRSKRKTISSQREHRLKKVKPALDSALRNYGSWFRRGWSQENLLDRAKRLNLDYLYPAYKLSSLIIHGAPGGILGLVRDIDGRKVHRTSAIAFDLCPFAYIAGVEAMKEVARAAGNRRTDLDISPFVDTLDLLRKEWPDYLEAMKVIDNRIWPKEQPPQATAILALSRHGDQQWYWYDPVTEVLVAADDPVLSSDENAQISNFIRHVRQNPNSFFVNGRQWATYHPAGQVVANPKRGARIIPAREVMLSAEEAAGMSRYYLAPDGTPTQGES